MEMILSHDDLMNADYSNRVKGCGWASQSVIGGIVLSVLVGPGAASAHRQGFTGLGFPRFQQVQPVSFSGVEASPAIVPVVEMINNIKDGWSLNMTELAELMGVQRPTLYNWLNGRTSPDVKLQKHLQTLAAAAADWKRSTAGANWDFLLDYTGPRADQVTIREVLSRLDVSTSEIRQMIGERMKQYQTAYAQSRQILGEPARIDGAPIHESTRKLNKRWSENAQRLHRARKLSR